VKLKLLENLKKHCTGFLQTWSAVADTQSVSALNDGPAWVRGLGASRDDGEVTDTFQWCRDVDIVKVEPRSDLPLTTNR
jgi:hypothetical protein